MGSLCEVYEDGGQVGFTGVVIIRGGACKDRLLPNMLLYFVAIKYIAKFYMLLSLVAFEVVT